MAAKFPEPPGGPRPQRPLAVIQQKLERLLHSRNQHLDGYKGEIVSMLDTLESLNRDSRTLRTRHRMGDLDHD